MYSGCLSKNKLQSPLQMWVVVSKLMLPNVDNHLLMPLKSLQFLLSIFVSYISGCSSVFTVFFYDLIMLTSVDDISFNINIAKLFNKAI